MIVVWGVDYGICIPYDGKGFRKAFDNSKDADRFIQLQCNRIDKSVMQYYHIYITNELMTIDKLMYYHNRVSLDSTIKLENYGIEAVNIEEVKRQIDLNYQMYLRQQADKKFRTDVELKQMSNNQLEDYRKRFDELGVNFVGE